MLRRLYYSAPEGISAASLTPDKTLHAIEMLGTCIAPGSHSLENHLGGPAPSRFRRSLWDLAVHLKAAAVRRWRPPGNSLTCGDLDRR